MTALFKIFDIVPGFVWAAITIALLAMTGIQSYRLTEEKNDFLRYRNEVTAATLAAEQYARQKENELRAEIERISANANKRRKDLERRSADVNRALDGLRKYIAEHAGDLPSNTECAGYAHGAATARELLGACATEYRSVAEGADKLRSQVIDLQEYARVTQ